MWSTSPFTRMEPSLDQVVPPRPSRQPRSDAERNRAKILAVAKRILADDGAATSLNQVARAAGVGIGTLYRHFPTRDALIEAAYRSEVDSLIEAAGRLTARDAVSALREWLSLFVEFLNTKHGMAEALASLLDGPDALYSGTPSRLALPLTALVERAVASGNADIGIEPLDLLRAIAAVAHPRHGAKSTNAADRMVDLLIRGLVTPR